jgi:hypothetical protein
MPLYESASRAYGTGRFADAAEYARHALGRARPPPLRAELLCLRGESLLRAGQARLAAQSFQDVLAQPEPNPYVAQALFGVMEARTADGDAEHARAPATSSCATSRLSWRSARATCRDPAVTVADSLSVSQAARAGPRRSRDGARPRGRQEQHGDVVAVERVQLGSERTSRSARVRPHLRGHRRRPLRA